MKREQLIQFNKTQMVEMDRHKWIESEKKGFDLGEQAYLDWVEKHSAQFRKEWLEEQQLTKVS